MALATRRLGRHSRQASKQGSSTPQRRTTDPATEDYIKRILCAHPPADSTTNGTGMQTSELPLDRLLPPLTSSNEVDFQLYALIAIVLDIFVQSWYAKITPDHDFANEVVQIIAHCTRNLEQRLRHVDLESMLLDELPSLFSAHLSAVEVARTNASKAYGRDAIRTIFHTLRPHNALTPDPLTAELLVEQAENENAWCQMLIDRVLPLVLPPEDIDNPTLHALVAEVLSELILCKSVCGKASESWLLWEGVTKLIYALRPRLKPHQQAEAPQIDRLEQFGLLDETRDRPDSKGGLSREKISDTLSRGFWAFLQVVSFASLISRAAVVALVHAARLPARASRVHSMTIDASFILLSHTIHTRLLDPALLPPALQNIRLALFPNNALAPARAPPTPGEVLAIKAECARVIVEAIPDFVRSRFFATDNVSLMHKDVEESLEMIGDEYVNKHLIISIIELIAVRLFPEISEASME
ncbi:hypothetical protein B0A48_11356 [Cryoendolithus antarcticus]|uniref:PXA domain-containing protein n=1 Tax=Cryoendolithus antarcticus TaxID=1507870 RepID=A0A1V8SVM9_9PEZI|nr:hypothetical protein B0A48_11356 [Cryoendolithus antarcticus]